MSASARRAGPGDRRCRHHRVDPRGPAPRRRRRPRRACWTTSSAAGGPTSTTPSPRGRVDLVEGDIRDRDLVHDLARGKDLVFHQAAIRITQCAEEPRLALEVLVDGTFNVVEAAAEHRVAKLVAASSASVYGMAEEFPTRERHHPYDNDTFYGAAKSFNEGMLAQLPRDARARLRAAALLQRLRSADGRARAVHRGPGPLDGAHRRRQAAADLRRRAADDGLRLHRRHRPRPTCWPPPATSRRGRLQHRQRRRRPACWSWPRRCCG